MKKKPHKFKILLCQLYCFFKGHDWVSYKLDNSDVLGGTWRSAWGTHTCARCGKEMEWQYDRP